MFDVQLKTQSEQDQKFEEPASWNEHQGAWCQESDNDESAELKNVTGDVIGNAFTGLKGGEEFGIEISGDVCVFVQDVGLEHKTDNNKEFT